MPEPLRCGNLLARHARHLVVREDDLQLLVRAWKEDRHARAEHLSRVARGGREQRLARVRQTDLATGRVEARGVALPGARGVGLVADPLGQVADDQGDEEHHGERDDVTRVGDCEAEERGNEEELEGHDAENGGEQRWAVAESHGDDDDPQQEHHHNVGQVRLAEDEPRDQRRPGDRDDGGEKYPRACLSTAPGAKSARDGRKGDPLPTLAKTTTG